MVTRILLGALVAASICGLSTPALAATGWNVRAGDAATGTRVSLAMGVTTSPPLSVQDAEAGGTIDCSPGNARGAVQVASNVDGDGVLSLSGPSFLKQESCSAAGGVAFDVTGSGTWSFNAGSYIATRDFVKGRLTNVIMHWASSDGEFCVFDAAGWVDATYSNVRQVLTPGSGELIVNKPNPNGCAGGLFNTGDHLNFTSGGLTVNPPAGDSPVTIRPAA